MSLRAIGRVGWVAPLLTCVLAGCHSDDLEPEAPADQSAVLTQKSPAEPPNGPLPVKEIPPPMTASTRLGFSKVVIEDGVPFCVFASSEEQGQVKYLADAKKQTLAAGSSVVIGAFSPWCVSNACDDMPSIQCHAEREGNTITVHSRYWGEHKDGATCTEDCRPVAAACETPKLERGKYTIRHGDKKFTLRIPSVLGDPCFGARKAMKVAPAPTPTAPAPTTPTPAPTTP
ncbi:MAG: hypothetical protein ACHQ53_09810 [Polyangiales bacterium]